MTPPCTPGRWASATWSAIVTGMGTELATAGTTRLLDAVPVERVVVVGITGAVENETPIGTLVLPEVVVNGATGGEYRPAPLGEGTPAGTMWTTDTLITDLDEIAGLRARGVVSLDMETAAIAALCEATWHPLVGVPGHQRPCHRRECRRGGVPPLQYGRVAQHRGHRAVLRRAPRTSRGHGQAGGRGLVATEAAADAAIGACAFL